MFYQGNIPTVLSRRETKEVSLWASNISAKLLQVVTNPRIIQSGILLSDPYFWAPQELDFRNSPTPVFLCTQRLGARWGRELGRT